MESEASTTHTNKQPSMMIITIRCSYLLTQSQQQI